MAIKQLKASTHDTWALDFFQDLVNGSLSPREFEESVQEHWKSRQVVLPSPGVLGWLMDQVDSLGRESDLKYKVADHSLKFQSQRLAGSEGSPGAIHIEAPAEKKNDPKLSELNRPLHMHSTSRINLVTAGRAIFYFLQQTEQGEAVVVSCPLEAGDLIFWPAWVPHTFNALNGFSVLSAMPDFIIPENDGYTLPIDMDEEEVDAIEHIPYSKYVAE